MTAQIPERLINECRDVNFGRLLLYHVVRGAFDGAGAFPMEPYPYQRRPQPPNNVEVATTCWRKYVATYRLRPDRRLELVEYRYPLPNEQSEIESVKELLSGDFWIVMGLEFFARRTYIPFREGTIVLSRTEWVVDSQRDRAPDDGHALPRFLGPPCPHCGKPLRTKLAKQCPHCFADWHARG